MQKIKLLAIGKSSKHNYYAFPKKQQFFSIARELLKLVGCPTIIYDGFARPTDKKWGEPIFDKEDNIKTYTDKRYAFEEKDKYVEMIFGKDKVFLMVHTEKDFQKKLSQFLKKFIK